MSSNNRVACLCCTNRPEWREWVTHQYEKQLWPAKELFIDEGDGLIPEKRTRLLQRAIAGKFAFVAWFDDDDWSSPTRLSRGVMIRPFVEAFKERPFSATGNVQSWMVSIENRRALRYHAPEGIIFNGAVFETPRVPETFNRALHVSEDTDWLERWQRRRPSYVVLGEPMQMWLCHRKNITNRVETKAFVEEPPAGLITEAEWSLVPR